MAADAPARKPQRRGFYATTRPNTTLTGVRGRFVKPPLHRFVDALYGTLVRIAGYFALVAAVLYGGYALIGGELRNVLADGRNTEWLMPKPTQVVAERAHQSLGPKLRGAVD